MKFVNFVLLKRNDKESSINDVTHAILDDFWLSHSPIVTPFSTGVTKTLTPPIRPWYILWNSNGAVYKNLNIFYTVKDNKINYNINYMDYYVNRYSKDKSINLFFLNFSIGLIFQPMSWYKGTKFPGKNSFATQWFPRYMKAFNHQFLTYLWLKLENPLNVVTLSSSWWHEMVKFSD